MKEIQIREGMKGVTVYAKFTPKPGVSTSGSDWIVLIHSVSRDYRNECYKIKRIVSYCTNDGFSYCDNPPGNWGNSKNYTFYKATDEQKKIIINLLRKRKKKYISVLGKVINV